MEMTMSRILLVVAVLLGLLSTSLGKAIRPDELQSRRASAPGWSGKSAPFDTRRLALVIGNSNYPDAESPLSQMTRDADTLASALRKDGFLVDVVDNATRADMIRAIDHLKARVHSNSIVLVYFGGYAIQSDGQNYLIPVDAKIWHERDVRREGLSLERLLSILKASGAQVRLLVIEASSRNPYERRFRAYSHGLAPIQTTKDTLVLSSAAPDHVVEDSDEPHSRLMTALLALMTSSRGIEGIFRGTRNEVAATTQGQQIPAVSSTLTENVSLRPARSGAPVSSVGSSRPGAAR